MEYLITGANGQLGQDIRKILAENSVKYVATGSKDLNITDLSSVISHITKLKPSVIVNCAAYNAVDQAEEGWKNAFMVNGLGVRNLAIAANNIGALLVHYSTDYVFDGESLKPYTIADSPRPISRYGESKLLGEHFIRDIARDFILVRTSWVFGSGNDNYPKKVIAWSKGKNELKFVTDQISSPSYTKDLAGATVGLIEKGTRGIFHVTNSGYCSRYEWAEYILDKIGWDGTVIQGTSDEFQTAAKRPRFSVLDPFGTPECLGYLLPDWKDATKRFLKEIEVYT